MWPRDLPVPKARRQSDCECQQYDAPEITWIFLLVRLEKTRHEQSLVGGPLDLAKVDAFLDHLVERRHLAEVLDYRDDLVRDVVDFGFIVEAAEAEADGAVRDIIA